VRQFHEVRVTLAAPDRDQHSSLLLLACYVTERWRVRAHGAHVERKMDRLHIFRPIRLIQWGSSVCVKNVTRIRLK